MQISIWYPAAAEKGAATMEFGAYIALQASALGLERQTETAVVRSPLGFSAVRFIDELRNFFPLPVPT